MAQLGKRPPQSSQGLSFASAINARIRLRNNPAMSSDRNTRDRVFPRVPIAQPPAAIAEPWLRIRWGSTHLLSILATSPPGQKEYEKACKASVLSILGSAFSD